APNLSSPPCLWHYVGCPKAHAATRGRGFAWAQSAGFPGAPGRALRYRDAIVAPPPAPESFRRGAIGSSAAGVHSARRPPTAAQRPPGGGRAPGGAGRRNQGRGVERAAGRGNTDACAPGRRGPEAQSLGSGAPPHLCSRRQAAMKRCHLDPQEVRRQRLGGLRRT
ncbi:unnamed protein product, partial [Prorocentrum cordatum]